MKKSANRSFLRVCRQRTILSLGKFSESAIGEWEFSQSLPTENYVVIGRVLRVRQESRKTTGSFPRVCQQRTTWSLGEFSDSAKKAESATGIGDWEFSQSLPTANYVVIGARSQTLPRKQNRRMGVFSESADGELWVIGARSQTLL